MMPTVTTVLGEIPLSAMGRTLMHEHLIMDARAAWSRPDDADAWGQRVAHEPLQPEFLTTLRHNPYASLDNMEIGDTELMASELAYFADAGGATIVEQTPEGVGRSPVGLARIAERSGVNIVMGCGFYLERSHPDFLASWSIDRITDHIVEQVLTGTDGVRAGVIGEIGVGSEPSDAEDLVLRAAARAQRITRVPLEIHLPAWARRGAHVLDIVSDEKADLSQTVMCHANPAGSDVDYLVGLAQRGVFVQFDMIGQGSVFPGEGECTTDREDAEAILRLVRLGHAGSLLLSSDVFLKMMLRRFGGHGYAHVFTDFRARLLSMGLTVEEFDQLTIHNPRRVFERAHV